MPKISGQSVISGQFQDSFEISGRLWPLQSVAAVNLLSGFNDQNWPHRANFISCILSSISRTTLSKEPESCVAIKWLMLIPDDCCDACRICRGQLLTGNVCLISSHATRNTTDSFMCHKHRTINNWLLQCEYSVALSVCVCICVVFIEWCSQIQVGNVLKSLR